MTRLTKDCRERIAKILLAHRFDAEGQALSGRSAELFTLVYEDQYDEPTRQLIAKLIRRHKNAFVYSSRIAVNVAGQRFDVGETAIGRDGIFWKSHIEPRPMFRSGHDAVGYIDCPIAMKLNDHAQKTEDFRSRLRQAKTEVLGVLGGFTTAKQLAATWPEAMPLIGHLIPDGAPTANLPAVQISRLNDAYGLPPVEQESAAA